MVSPFVPYKWRKEEDIFQEFLNTLPMFLMNIQGFAVGGFMKCSSYIPDFDY